MLAYERDGVFDYTLVLHWRQRARRVDDDPADLYGAQRVSKRDDGGDNLQMRSADSHEHFRLRLRQFKTLLRFSDRKQVEIVLIDGQTIRRTRRV